MQESDTQAMTIFMYGDSFSVSNKVRYTSWIDQLHGKHQLTNRSIEGASNHYIFLKFMEDLDRITTDDLVVFCWSENQRYYQKDTKKTQEVDQLYHKHFYNQRLLEMQSEMYLDKIEAVVKERKIHMLFFWAFPSGYTDSKNWWWISSKSVSEDRLIYSHTFENEVRPALMYFSRMELSEENFPINDIRPNHIASQRLHDELFKIVDDVFHHRLEGQINLKNRLHNGS
jgi:hypothetical protein